MTTPNTLRRLNWLWKHRHTHDDDDTQDQITVIREIIERDADEPNTSGAYIHLWTVAQTIAVDGEALEFSSYGLFPPFEFSETFPVTEVTIRKSGYYNVDLEDLAWDTYTGGGTIQFVRIRDSEEIVVREFTSTYGRETNESIAHAIPCQSGDKIKVVVDHNDSVTHDLAANAKVAIYLVDGAEETGTANVVDKITSTDLGTTHTISMTSAQEDGDLLLMFLVASASDWSAYPSGWTLLEDNFEYRPTTGGHMSVLYKVSDGTETNVTANTTSSNGSVHAVWVIRSEQDYSTVTPDSSASPSTSAGVDSIDPPAVSVSHGEATYLSFALVGRNGGSVAVETTPTNYSEFLADARGGGSRDPAINIFDRRLIIATTEDPTTAKFTPNWTGQRMGATTVAVKI